MSSHLGCWSLYFQVSTSWMKNIWRKSLENGDFSLKLLDNIQRQCRLCRNIPKKGLGEIGKQLLRNCWVIAKSQEYLRTLLCANQDQIIRWGYWVRWMGLVIYWPVVTAVTQNILPSWKTWEFTLQQNWVTKQGSTFHNRVSKAHFSLSK